MALTTIDDRGLNYPVDLLDNEKIRFGTGGDGLEIYHDGSNSYIQDNGTGELRLRTNTGLIRITKDDTETLALFNVDGGSELWYDNVKKLETTSLGIDVTGSIRGDDITIEKPSGHLSAYFTATDGLGTLEIGGSDGAFIDLKTPVSDDFDLRINADGTLTSVGSITLAVNSNENGLRVLQNGAVELYHDNTKRLETDSGGVTVTDDLTVTNDVKLADDGKLICGNSSDLKIYHDGTDTFIKNATGNLLIGDTDGNVVLQGKWGEDSLICKPDGAVELNFDNNKKFETLTDGARVSGDCQISRNRFIGSISGGSSISIGTSGGSQVGFFEETGNHDSLRFYVHESGVSHGECARFSYRGALCIGTTTQEEPGNGNTTTGNVLKTNGRYFHSMPGTWGCTNRNDSDGTIHIWARAGSHVGSITVNSSSTAYNTSSDYRLKENVTAISDGITRLKTLKPSRFNFKSDASTTVDGFLAHEVTAVPEAIFGVKDGVYDEDDDEANIKKGDPLYQVIDQSKLVPLLTAALQEAITEIETLKTKVAALEAA